MLEIRNKTGKTYNTTSLCQKYETRQERPIILLNCARNTKKKHERPITLTYYARNTKTRPERPIILHHYARNTI